MGAEIFREEGREFFNIILIVKVSVGPVFVVEDESEECVDGDVMEE